MAQVQTYCALCVSRCGAIATVEDGRLVALDPDPAHPTGGALCMKGKAAPELVTSSQRLHYPMKRTRPKGERDPGWQRITWDEALTTAADKLQQIARTLGPHAVAFASSTPSATAMCDSMDYLTRLRRAFGSPNMYAAVELCGWGRFFAPLFTFGASVPGAYLPELEQAGCILYWGYNPSVSRLAHATATIEALGRGAKLVVVDPRRAGLARRAHEWLRVRPGTDGALALAIAGVMLERGWFDQDFVRQWTNAPLLVRGDDGRLLRGDGGRYVAWDVAVNAAVHYDPARGAYDCAPRDLALSGEHQISTPAGMVTCRPVFDHLTELCRRYTPAAAQTITGVPSDQIERTARLLWESRPLAFYAWSGVEQHTGATNIARAIGQLCALTGSFDAPGGNVLFPAVPSNPVAGVELATRATAKPLGATSRALGLSRFEHITAGDLYTAALDGTPYPVRGLVAFGANMTIANSDSRRGRDALSALDFFIHADLFMNPTAECADIVLPVASAFESEALRLGFETSAHAQTLVQLRQRLVEPPGEARGDLQIIFDLATRLGLGQDFWGGDIEAAWRHQLAPSGVTLEQLRDSPGGIQVPAETRYRRYAAVTGGVPRGFDTPTKKIELYSETLLAAGYSPLPVYEEPAVSPRSRPDLAEAFPLVLTCAKDVRFCDSQHRALPSLRKGAPDPQVELHTETARTRGVAPGDWVHVVTPHGKVRARAKLNDSLAPDVVCAQHGWWQACEALGLPEIDAFGEDSANLNAVLPLEPADPVSGSAPLRSYVCNITRAT